MVIALLILGVALVAFGALVLLKYSDRPGGTIKWLGVEISSKGAGLPLIALGVGCIGFAAVRFPLPSPAPDPVPIPPAEASQPLTGPPITALYGKGSDTSCDAALLRGVARERVRTLEVGMRDVEIIGSHQKLDAPFALLLTESGQRIGALRLRLYRASNSSADLYKIEQAVDAGCANVEEMSNTSHGGNPRELLNWDTLRERLGAHQYELRIGGDGSVNVGYFTRVPSR